MALQGLDFPASKRGGRPLFPCRVDFFFKSSKEWVLAEAEATEANGKTTPNWGARWKVVNYLTT